MYRLRPRTWFRRLFPVPKPRLADRAYGCGWAVPGVFSQQPGVTTSNFIRSDRAPFFRLFFLHLNYYCPMTPEQGPVVWGLRRATRSLCLGPNQC